MKFNKERYSIYCENYSQYLLIQEYFFSLDIPWCSDQLNKTIFTKEKWPATIELTFPRFISLTRHNNNKYYIGNVTRIYDDSDDTIIYASHLLRKYKLNKLKLNESKQILESKKRKLKIRSISLSEYRKRKLNKINTIKDNLNLYIKHKCDDIQ